MSCAEWRINLSANIILTWLMDVFKKPLVYNSASAQDKTPIT